MAKKKTAPAEQPPIIKGARTTRIREGARQHTAVIYIGDAPAVNEVIRFELANGVTYEGTVKDVTTVGEEVLAEFSDGPRPVTTK
jgi:hypothetical protein